MGDNFPLFVDPRIGSVELIKYLQVPSEVTKLEFGDVSFAGWGPDETVLSVGIERKTIRDLVNSIQSGRLSGHQLIGLLEWYHVVYILIEGAFRVRGNVVEVMEGGKWKPLHSNVKPGHTFGYIEIANYLNTLANITNVKVWMTENIQTSALWIRHTYYWWQKKYEDHKAHLDFHQGPVLPKRMRMTRPTTLQRMIKEIPGVGWDRAMEITKLFPTMEEVMRATDKDLIRVPGVGKVLSKEIFKELHRK